MNFEEVVEKVTLIDYNAFAYELSQAIDPFNELNDYYASICEYLLETNQTKYLQPLADWYRQQKKKQHDRAVRFPAREAQQDNSQPYSAKYDYRDAWGFGYRSNKAPVFVGSSTKQSREVWQRVTKNEDRETFILCDWGNFSLSRTENYHKSLYKTRTAVEYNFDTQQHEPILQINRVFVNLKHMRADCRTIGCRWTLDLDIAKAGVERQEQEFKVLQILEHLGTHGKITPIKRVRPLRDSVEQKLASRTLAKAGL